MATLTGLAGSAHFGFGKGVGALVGGVLKDQLQSTMITFRVFGVAGFVSAFLYTVYSYTLGRHLEKKMAKVGEMRETGVLILIFCYRNRRKSIFKSQKPSYEKNKIIVY